MSAGQLDAHGVVVSEAMAASQNLKLGDSLQLTFAGVDKPVILPVSGIVDLSSADVLFAAAGENNVVADVVFVHIDWFRANLLLPLAAYAANPPASLPAGSVILDQQAHIKIDRSLLPADPAQALLYTDSLRRLMERQFPGQLKVTDMLFGALKSAQADVLSAKILFIFLGLPGVALAAYLSKFAAELFAEAQRRELGLLRTRGATPAQITAIVAGASALLAVGGSLLGIGFGVVTLLASAGSQVSGSLNPFAPGFDWALFAGSALIAFLAGLALTFLSAFLPAFGALRREITDERRTARRSEGAPFWKRSYLDVLLLGAAAVVLVVTQLNGGFKPPATEGAAISLSFYVFLAPLFAWLGLTLLTLRLVERGLALAARPIAAGFRRVFGEIGEVAGKSVARRAARVSAGHDGHRADAVVRRQPGAVPVHVYQRKASRRAVCGGRGRPLYPVAEHTAAGVPGIAAGDGARRLGCHGGLARSPGAHRLRTKHGLRDRRGLFPPGCLSAGQLLRGWLRAEDAGRDAQSHERLRARLGEAGA